MARKINKIWAVQRLGQFVCVGLLMSTAIAAEPLQYDIVNIQAQRSIEVDNDLMVAELGVEMEGREPVMLAGKINTAMTWALNEAKKSTTVDVTTGNYYVHAVYDKTEISHWRASQLLNLKSKDVAEMARLIGVLQNRLIMKSMEFSISEQKKDGVENELIDGALEAFKKRANIVTANLGAKGYRIVDVTIGSPDSLTPPHTAMRALTMKSDFAAPAVEPGMSTITVVVSGAIQLQ